MFTHWRNKSIVSRLALLILLISGIFLRSLYPMAVSFGFDQVQILESVERIRQGDVTLIGPRTGPADMFTGPLIYYLAVPFVTFFGEVKTVVIVPLVIALITGMCLFGLIGKYIGKKEAWLATFIWAFSPFLISIDRVFWNPNLTLLSSFLLIIPLLKTNSKQIDRITLLSIGIGSFLSYQAHFSGLLLVAIAFACLFYLKKPLVYSAAIVFSLAVSVLPTVLFDIRHNFLNLRGLLNLISTKSEFNGLILISDIAHNIYVIIETTGKLFLFGSSTIAITLCGLLLIVAGIWCYRKNKEVRLTLLCLMGIAVSYAFYHGEKPEYYFLIALPFLFYIVLKVLKNVPRMNLFFFLFIFAGYSLFMNIRLLSEDTGLSLGNIQKVQQYLHQQSVSEVIYDLPMGSEFGMKYFLAKVVHNETGKIYHVAYPDVETNEPTFFVGRIGVWAEQ